MLPDYNYRKYATKVRRNYLQQRINCVSQKKKYSRVHPNSMVKLIAKIFFSRLPTGFSLIRYGTHIDVLIAPHTFIVI